MSGSATFTIVMSSRSMKTPTQTAASVHHLASVPSVASVCGSTGTVTAGWCSVIGSLLSERFINCIIIKRLTISFGTIRFSANSSSA